MYLAIRYTFKVYERLKREQHIHTLFLKGKAFSVFPLRVVYITVPRTNAKDSPVLTGFSVPKKKFKHSVDRHRVRRLIVEAWRMHKHAFYQLVPADQQVHLFFIYTDNKLPDYATIEKSTVKGIEKLCIAISAPVDEVLPQKENKPDQ